MTTKRVIREAIAAVLIGLLGFLAAVTPAGAAERVAARAEIAAMLPEAAQWSLVVIDMATGREAVHLGSGAARALVPGSLVKLLTAGALLDLAASHTPDLRTTLGHDGTIASGVLSGNLYLSGRGNALLSTADLAELVKALTESGVGRVEGDLVVDATRLDAGGVQRKRGSPARAVAGALGLDLHTVAVTVTPAAWRGAPTVAVEPPNDQVRIALEAKSVALTGSAPEITRLDDLSYRVTGNISLGGASVRRRFPLSEPALFAGGTLRTLLRRGGIGMKGLVRTGEEPGKARQLAAVHPPDLDTLLRDMNTQSLNVVADNLLLVLGGERFAAPGTRDKGVRALTEFLERLGFAADEATIADGSGVHDDNRLTAEFLARYLYRVASKPWFDRFYATLPRAGMDGTLRDYPFVDERFRVKTGNLENAYSLAGYGVARQGRRVAFSFIVNHPGCGVLEMKKAGGALMKHLATEVLW
ncbi:MAG: D-alanyl-D-alanine carboxypeptidase/D-alanyl-D-alanine-endopeptidase [Geobacteraceae bacterium GWC2_58_44]|nr:MAG: D-alanyl-D-alanine carboxypeptidase/D-alanyl-D-alanine-endopeptidase [Geobacteraceae bacterium GWC2_58_44]